MKHKFTYFPFLLMALFCMLMSLASCNQLKDLINPDDPDDPDEPPTVSMVSSNLSGVVRDTAGEPLQGVEVLSGTSGTFTNEGGMFNFSELAVEDNRSVVRFSREGYFDVVRSASLTDGDIWEVVMCKKENSDCVAVDEYASSSEKTLQAGGMTIELPRNAYKVDQTGAAYTGRVKTAMLYLSPNNEHFADMMPGSDLAAVRTDQSRATLLSYGMVDLNMTADNGDKLQLSEGTTAKLTFPIPKRMEDTRPATIPLWSFNDSTGLWEEEGVATLQGDVYVGDVKHFSWVNLDYPESQATVEGYVKDDRGQALQGVRVTVGQLLTKITNENGYYCQEVPAGTDFKVSVKSHHYGNYSQEVSVNVPALSPREVRRVDIVLPHRVRVYGKVVDKTGAGVPSTVWVKVGDTSLKSVQTDRNGNFSIYIPDGVKGDGEVRARTSNNAELSKDIIVDKEDVYVELAAMGEGGSGGSGDNLIHIYSVLGNEAWLVPSSTSLESGVIIVDGELMLMAGEDEAVTLALQIPNYSSDHADYGDGVKLSIYNNDEQAGFGVQGTGQYTVRRVGDAYSFSLRAPGTFYKSASGSFDEGATATADDMRFNFFFAGKSLRNIVPREAGFPSFTPQLATKAPLALLITESAHLGKGGMVYYNGGLAEYQSLRNAAAKLGYNCLGEDIDDEYREVVFYSAKKQAFVMLEYDRDQPGTGSDTSWSEAEAPITVTVLDGLSEEYLEALFGDDDYSAAKVAGKKKFQQVRRLLKANSRKR